MTKAQLYVIVGTLFAITANKTTGYFFPWQLHLAAGLGILSYGTYLLLISGEKKKHLKYLIPLWIAVAVILAYNLFPEQKSYRYGSDGNHPFENSMEYTIAFVNEDGFKGKIKLNEVGIFMLISKPYQTNIDSVHVSLDNKLLRDTQISLTCLMNARGEVKHCSTGKNFLQRKSEEIYVTDKLYLALLFEDNTKGDGTTVIDIILFNGTENEHGRVLIN